MSRIPYMRLLTGMLFVLVAGTVGAQPVAPSFTFTLPDSARTSAGVFGPDGALLRTLWSGVSFGPGNHTRSWDGTDDEGRLLPEATYSVRVLTNRVSYTWEGVVGNTSAAKSGSTYLQSLENVACMAIAGNTAYYGTHYNEQKTSSFKVNVTSPDSKTDVLTKGAMVWLVASDGTNVYWGGTDPNHTSISFAFMTSVANDSEVKTTNSTTYKTTHGRAYASALSVIDNPNATLSGLAVQKSGRYLLLSRQWMNTIYVLDKQTGALVTTVAANAPRQLAIDPNDNVWLISGSNTVQHYILGPDGTLTPNGPALPGLQDPMAVGVSPDGRTVVVADGGSHQLKAFAPQTGAALWTHGQAGGYTTDPTVSTDKFCFGDARSSRNPITPTATVYAATFVAFAPDGSFWVNDVGNSRVLHFAANRTYLNQLMYLTGSLNCSVDHNNPSRVFSDFLEFNVDYNKPLQPDNGSWRLVKNWGVTIPKSHDANLYTGRFRNVATLSNGRTYSLLSTIERGRTTYELVELPPTGPLRLTGIRLPDATYQLYPDGSLRVQSIAQVGQPIVWQQRLLTGFDAQHNPQWGPLQPLAQSPPLTPADPGFRGNPVSLASGEVTTSNVVVAFDGGRQPLAEGPWYHLGGIRAGTNTWLWRTAPSSTTQYTGDYPTDGTFDIGNGVNNAGSRAVAVGRHIFWGYYGEFWKAVQTNKWQHVYDNGLFVGQFGVTGRDGPLFELFPGLTGNAFSVYVVPSPTDPNTAYLYHNDDGAHCGVHRWRIGGLNTVQEQRFSVTLATPQRGLTAEYMDGRELDNVQLKTTRLDSSPTTVWPSGPTGTALADPANSSVRWQGFVQPTSSSTYTFFANTNGKIKVWVDGVLLINQWDNALLREFGTAGRSLQAGVRYPLRIEYVPSNGAAQLDLLWSAPGIPKQSIPAGQLFPTEVVPSANGVDLLAYLQPESPLESLYGWVRSPVGEDYTDVYRRWWSARTSVKTYGRDRLNTPDLWVKQVNTTGTHYVSRSLAVSTENATWRLSGRVHYEGEDGNKPGGSTGYVDVLDDQDKLIVRLYVANLFPNIALYANNKLLAELPKADMLDKLYRIQPLDIRLNDGQLTIQYGSFPTLTAPPLDAGANWKRPRTLRLLFSSGPDGSGHAFGIERVRFQMGNSTQEPTARFQPTLRVYPNPAQGVVTVEFPLATQAGYIEVVSLTGQVIVRQPVAVGSSSTQVDLNGLSQATYLLRYVNGPIDVSTRVLRE